MSEARRRRSEARERLREELVVLAARRGDRDAFRTLVERWQAPLLRHVGHLVGTGAAAEDVVQDTWLRVIRSLGSLRDPARFRGFLFGVATRAAREGLRRRGRAAREEPLAIEPPSRESRCELDGGDGDERAERLARALAQLSGEERALLGLRYGEGLSVVEIARALELPEGTVKSRLYALRRRLEERSGSPFGTQDEESSR